MEGSTTSGAEGAKKDGAVGAEGQGEKSAEKAAEVKKGEKKARGARGKWVGMGVIGVALVAGVVWYVKTRGVVSTDDAYVNGRVTFVAARVPGQIKRVLVDDNNRVRVGQALVELDREPYEKQRQIAEAAVEVARSELTIALAQAQGITGQMRSLRFGLEHAMEEVRNQKALLQSRIAVWQSQKAKLEKALADFNSAAPLLATGGVSRDEYNQRKAALDVARAGVEESLQGIYQVRVTLGLPPQAENEDYGSVPEDLDQTFSTVREAQASLLQVAAALGVTDSFTKTPKQMIEDFYKRSATGDINEIYEKLIRNAPGIKQAESKLNSAQRNLELAEMNLRYCTVVSEIDGVVTRRDVNPGNNVTAGQALMAVRSLTEVWVDANFKETQLSEMRIGQPVELDVDMYGVARRFRGRITGFTMGTGSTLSLLPAENATGNYVKVVQRLPVRVDLLDYDPEKAPLFVGLSVTARVRVDEKAEGENAGAILQPFMPTAATATTGVGAGTRP